jgi:protein tyrosine phosphatase (PTP) superfamily phosphohydrolase (DUF442 family)
MPHPKASTPRRFSSARAISLFGLLLLIAVGFVAFGADAKSPDRKRDWATKIDKPGLPNLHQVAPGLYRGAQPTAEGMKELEKMGVKTVINLRDLHSDRDLIGKTKLAYEHIPVTTWSPDSDEIVRFLRIVTDKKRGPFFVHCQHGADRTGTMCAVYRIVIDGWSKQEAIKEMTDGGFGFHSVWQNLVRFVEKLDVDVVKKKAGI